MMAQDINNTGNYYGFMKLRAVVSEDEDGVFVAEIPSLPGCVSQGKSKEEALENVKDAARGYISSLKKHDEDVPPSSEEMVEINV